MDVNQELKVCTIKKRGDGGRGGGPGVNQELQVKYNLKKEL